MSNEQSAGLSGEIKLWARGWTTDGRQMSLEWTGPAAEMPDSFALDSLMKSAGYSVQPPEDKGEKREEIEIVSRRRTPKGVDVVDCYLDRLTFRKGVLWLDTPERVEGFERATGLTLADMPYYESKSARDHEPGKLGEFEIALAKPFTIEGIPKRKGGEVVTQGGHIVRRWQIPGVQWYTGPQTSAPAQNTEGPAFDAARVDKMVAYAESKGIDEDMLAEILEIPAIYRIEALNKKHTGTSAMDAIEDHIKQVEAEKAKIEGGEPDDVPPAPDEDVPF